MNLDRKQCIILEQQNFIDRSSYNPLEGLQNLNFAWQSRCVISSWPIMGRETCSDVVVIQLHKHTRPVTTARWALSHQYTHRVAPPQRNLHLVWLGSNCTKIHPAPNIHPPQGPVLWASNEGTESPALGRRGRLSHWVPECCCAESNPYLIEECGFGLNLRFPITVKCLY